MSGSLSVSFFLPVFLENALFTLENILLFFFLSSRDLVHRQTACAAIKHMAIGVFGFGCEDALGHLVNNVWPNIFETSPHVVNAFTEAVEGLRVGCGAAKVLQYTLQVIFCCYS